MIAKRVEPMKQLGLGLNLSTKKTRKREFLEAMDPAMEEALHDVPLYREFAKLDGVMARLPDETSTKNLEGERDPEMKQRAAAKGANGPARLQCRASLLLQRDSKLASCLLGVTGTCRGGYADHPERSRGE